MQNGEKYTKDNLVVGTEMIAKQGCTTSITPMRGYKVQQILYNGVGFIDDFGRQHLMLWTHIDKHFEHYYYKAD